MARGLKNPKKADRKAKKRANGESSTVPSMPAKIWQPGVDPLEEGEELQCDPSAYDRLHAFHVGWPCLSFDILGDTLGMVRTEFPHTVYCVSGTQAEKASWNSIGIFKLSNISGKRRDLVLGKAGGDGSDMEDSDSNSSDEEEESEENGTPYPPALQIHKIAHQGSVNLIRAMRQSPHICASWGDTGHVQIWDFSNHLNCLAESETGVSTGASNVVSQAPLMKFGGHKTEGFAIDWSPLVPGRLVSGDCDGRIHLWEPSSDATWNVGKPPFDGHDLSVEDLQWSPIYSDIFSSCSVDGTVAVWDIRIGKKPAVSINAHKADVNVISWNGYSFMMISTGTFSIHNLRMLKPGDSSDTVVAHFEYHKRPITSLEWSPYQSSMLAVTSEDNQLTIWDFSLERDEEEEAEFRARMPEQVNSPEDLPPQLLFVHQGQKDMKELHWHAQIPGMIMTTASDGFDILKPSNIDTTIP
ncbi:glutamate-rich WD repeat-containing protein 1-like [Papaver somniferum]|uniref:glutamate-rich WD repeat-containing protein 1-like n=1 Tax=Papaver somniferum TaxID=3469 RepID=UPI000E6FBF1A|nr:glutamate-rich WD repeat-containing protein 1-like [Papaver somniferum]